MALPVFAFVSHRLCGPCFGCQLTSGPLRYALMDRSQALLELGLRGLELGEGIREVFQLLVQLLLD
jgi:hypothetical protein